MNPLEERLNRLETRITRYRNFNVLLCLLLVTVVTVAARDVVSPFQAKSAHEPIGMPGTNMGVADSPDRGVPDVVYPEEQAAGKLAAQTQGVIRATGLQIVNGDDQAVVELWPSTAGGGLIFVNSAEDKRLVYIGSSAARGDGLVLVDSKEEKNLIALGPHSETGHGGIWIRNNIEEMLIGLNADETPGIHINKTGNQNLTYLGANTLSNGLLRLSHQSGTDMVSMYASDTSGNLSLYNKDDKRIARIGAFSAGDGYLKINSKTGTELITAGSNTNDNGLIRVSNSYGTLGVWIVGANKNGYVGIQNAQERLITELTATAGGNGLVRTLSTDGITAWSSASFQGTAGSTSLKGDMDNDGDIDGDDFLIFSENFGKKK
ncbi:MAG: hypothetical protein OXR72_07450 [Gemmatimonadota bacterium]|nr:hypothetical protein [Gemmatimonadota bacterium]